MAHRALNAFPKMLNPQLPESLYVCAVPCARFSHILFPSFLCSFSAGPRTSGQVEWTEVTAEQLPQLTRRVGRGWNVAGKSPEVG